MLPIESSTLLPLLESYTYKHAHIFKKQLMGLPLKRLLADKLIDALLKHISKSAWFLISTHEKHLFKVLKIERDDKGTFVSSAEVLVRKIAAAEDEEENEEETLDSYLFNDQPLTQCLEDLCGKHPPVDLSSLKPETLFNAKYRYIFSVKRKRPTKLNTVINQIELSPTFVDIKSESEAANLLHNREKEKFITWKRTPKHENKKHRYCISYVDNQNKVITAYFKIFPSGRLIDRDGELFNSFVSRSDNENCLLKKYEGALAQSLSLP